MNYRQHIKETFTLALPVSIGFFGHIMLGVVDSIMIGSLGATYLAASALVNSMIFLIFVLGIGMSIAITPLVAIARGSDNHEECGIILRQGFIVNMLYSLLLVAASYFTADLLKFMDQPEDVVVLAETYMKILSFSLIPFTVFQVFRQFIEGLSDTKPAMYINISAIFINAFGNWLLIYGNWGFPRLELDGAGYASFATRIFIALVMVFYVIYSSKYAEYDASFRFKNINYRVMRKIINIGIPTGLQMFFEVGAFSVAAIIIGWMGTNFLAAHQIAITLASISFMIILGISSAATIRVGNFIGKNNYDDLNKASNTALGFAATFMCLSGLTFVIARNYLPTIYISDPEVIDLASNLLIFAALFQVFDGIQAAGLGVLRGMTDVKIPMFISFIAYWIIGIPVGYFLGFNYNLNANGVWISLTLALILAAVFFTIRIRNNINNYSLNKN